MPELGVEVAEAEQDKPKHAGGRPLKFKNVKKLQAAIDGYFVDCDPHAEEITELVWHEIEEEYQDKDGETKTRLVNDYSRPPYESVRWHITAQKPYTITGLAVWLETSRRTLINYEGKPKFFHTVKGAKDRIEDFWEHQLLGSHATGPIFNLKNNFEWQDAQQVDHTTKGNAMPLLGGTTPMVDEDDDGAQADDEPAQDPAAS